MSTVLALSMSCPDYSLPGDKKYTDPEVETRVIVSFDQKTRKMWHRAEDEATQFTEDIAIVVNRLRGLSDSCGSEGDGQAVNFTVASQKLLRKSSSETPHIEFTYDKKGGYFCKKNVDPVKKAKIEAAEQEESEDEEEDDDDDDADREDSDSESSDGEYSDEEEEEEQEEKKKE